MRDQHEFFRRALQPAILALASLVFAGLDSAGTVQGQMITEFELPTPSSSPNSIVVGPDGNLWFTEPGSRKIGRITTAGAITEFPIPGFDGPGDIAVGPDGNLWFTTGGLGITYEQDGSVRESQRRVVRMTTTGAITEFVMDVPPYGIVAGPDGALWFAKHGIPKIGRITTAGVVTDFATNMDGPVGCLTPGPDGALWFTQVVDDTVGRISTKGAVRKFTPKLNMRATARRAIAAGVDGNVWFACRGAFARVAPDGVITEFPIPKSIYGAYALAAGPDESVWFLEANPADNKVGKITTAGTITRFAIPTARCCEFGSGGSWIVAGPDDALWFVENGGNKIGRITTGQRHRDLPVVNAR